MVVVYWYFVSKIVLSFCEKKFVLVIEKIFCKHFETNRTFYLKSERLNQLLKQFKFEKNNWDLETCRKKRIFGYFKNLAYCRSPLLYIWITHLKTLSFDFFQVEIRWIRLLIWALKKWITLLIWALCQPRRPWCQQAQRWSTCVLVYFSWLLNLVIYLKLRRE